MVISLLTLGIFTRTKLLKSAPKHYAELPLAILVILFMMKLPALYQYPKQDFTGARDYVKNNMHRNDKVVVLAHAGYVFTNYYAKEWKTANSIADLRKYQSQEGCTWILYSLPQHIKNAMPEISHAIKKDYKLQKIFHGTLGGGDIFIHRSKCVDKSIPDK